jgi:GT2 family glycosyltransferase
MQRAAAVLGCGFALGGKSAMNSQRQINETTPAFVIVVSITHNLADLERCLLSLNGLDYPRDRFQAVFVDCGVAPEIQPFLEERRSDDPIRTTVLELPDRAVDRDGWFIEARISEARNFAVKHVAATCYVFTSDDCTFPKDWLRKFEAALNEQTGALGGPDILPQGLGWYPEAIDCVLNSFLGNAGMRGGDKIRPDDYYPRKENMAVPGRVFDRLGYFSEERLFGSEMDMAQRLRNAGLQVTYLPDNPVWHRRVTTFSSHVRIKADMTSEKVQVTREHGTFFRSPYFMILLAIMALVVAGVASAVHPFAIGIFGLLFCVYSAALFWTAGSCAFRKRSIAVGLGVLLLMPLHHAIIVFGTVRGSVCRNKPSKPLTP